MARSSHSSKVFAAMATTDRNTATAMMVACNVVVPQLFWFQKIRTTSWLMWIIALLALMGAPIALTVAFAAIDLGYFADSLVSAGAVLLVVSAPGGIVIDGGNADVVLF